MTNTRQNALALGFSGFTVPSAGRSIPASRHSPGQASMYTPTITNSVLKKRNIGSPIKKSTLLILQAEHVLI